MKPTEMLAELLRRATLTGRERESFEDMFDRLNRFKRCSSKQKAWIEKVYFGQKLDQQAPNARRRIVVPTWQKDATSTKGSAAPTAPVLGKAVGTQAQAQPAVSTQSRQVLVKNRPRAGAFARTPAALQTAQAPQARQIGYINYSGVQSERLVTNLSTFEEICPRIPPGSRQHQKVAKFFAHGGVVLKVKPLDAVQVA